MHTMISSSSTRIPTAVWLPVAAIFPFTLPESSGMVTMLMNVSADSAVLRVLAC